MNLHLRVLIEFLEGEARKEVLMGENVPSVAYQGDLIKEYAQNFKLLLKEISEEVWRTTR